ncbi:PREDICTED: LOW QUALITY PROTEIN: uncharacterized protein C9orf152 homolog [Gavialis gangeticus]|uniref:LOW QUALITY PROTEIN: uncharacterized protein C9orf152 homolog n=1 Tax=Gavialis gangeticus TaxID=94835 RepID=UPI00092F9382|nr:PREDICTED: LOW QUALITY PROTEIN: uncharacterized protein C9orf152 homolog [Gavialis gangeticus]
MKGMPCFCLTLSSLWERMVKAYKYMGSIFTVTHTSVQQASDCDGQPTKMDVSILEEQYDCIKQKQKLKTHIIVFKTGENDSVHEESLVNAVLINKKERKTKAFKECLPVRNVSLELTCNGNIEDNSAWRTHLGIHRLVQAGCQRAPCDLSHCKNKPRSFDNERLTLKENITLPCEKSQTMNEQATKLPDELENSSVLSSPAGENSASISDISQNSPLKSVTSAIWTDQQISSTKCMPASNKLTFYPFPKKKHPGSQKLQEGLDYMSHHNRISIIYTI